MAQIFPVLAGAAALGFLAGGATTLLDGAVAANSKVSAQAFVAASTMPQVRQCVAVDGDTLRCGGERIRLIGIDSPEMPGHCREGRDCVNGDPFAAKASLAGALAPAMEIRRFGTDHYGRTLALVRGPTGDLSCTQWRTGHAIYRADWDENGAMMQACA